MRFGRLLRPPRNLQTYPLVSNACRTCEHQAIASGAWNMAVGANLCAGDIKLVAKGTTQNRVEYALDLPVVGIVREGEDIEDGYCCVEYVYYQVPAGGRRSDGGERGSQPERSTQVDISADNHVPALRTNADVLCCQAIVNLPAPDGWSHRCQGRRRNLDVSGDAVRGEPFYCAVTDPARMRLN